MTTAESELIRVGVGGRLSRNRVYKRIQKVFFGNGRPNPPAKQIDTRITSQVDLEHIKQAVIPRLRDDLHNLQHAVSEIQTEGQSEIVVLNPYIDFVYTSLTADHHDPVIDEESITTRDTSVTVSRNGLQEQESAVEARHNASRIQRVYVVNPRTEGNKQLVERLMKGDLIRHIHNWSLLMSYQQLPVTAENIQKVLHDTIWKNGQESPR